MGKTNKTIWEKTGHKRITARSETQNKDDKVREEIPRERGNEVRNARPEMIGGVGINCIPGPVLGSSEIQKQAYSRMIRTIKGGNAIGNKSDLCRILYKLLAEQISRVGNDSTCYLSEKHEKPL